MDISDKTNLAVLQTNRPASVTKNDAGNLSKADSGTKVANPSLVDASAASTQNREQQLESAVSRINEYVQNIQRSIEFSVDEATGKDVVKILDKQTEEVIRQIPSEEVLAIAKSIADYNADTISIFTSRA
ncbi:flagellar protein FlaG [Methylophaga sp.]|uniref:flagellar protein FlaG n=1 Tax=Methylophaga sp. TaxID=2024840 RepID=UPI003F69D602